MHRALPTSVWVACCWHEPRCIHLVPAHIMPVPSCTQPTLQVPAAAVTAADLDVCIADLCDDYDLEYGG